MDVHNLTAEQAALLEGTSMTYAVTLESYNYGTTEAVDSTTVEASSQREAEKLAARQWKLRPHEWCFEFSPFRVQANEIV